jgi:hypothetical protein
MSTTCGATDGGNGPVAKRAATPSATADSTIAVTSATTGGNAPSASTREPPDQRVGVVFARSAATSKKSFE